MRKNILFCIFIIIVVLLFSLPFVDGIIVKRKFISLLQTMNGKHTQIKLLSYHRGWFTSTAVVVVKLPKEKVSSRLTLNIHHGPLIFTSIGQHVTNLAWAFFDINAFSKIPTLKNIC